MQPCASSRLTSSGGSGPQRIRAPPRGARRRFSCRQSVLLLDEDSRSHVEQVRAEVGALDGEPDDGLQVVAAVAGVVAAAREEDAVHRAAVVVAAGEHAQRVGQLDLAAAARLGLAQDVEDLGCDARSGR